MSTFSVIILTIIMTVIPYVYFIYKYENKNKLWLIPFTLGGIILTLIMFACTKTKDKYLELVITSLLCCIINYFISSKAINIKKLPKTMWVFFLFMFSSLFQLLVLPFLKYDLNNLTANQNLLLSTFSNGVLLIILLTMYFDELKKDFKNLKGKFNAFSDVAVKCWLIGLIIMIITNTIIGKLTPAQTVNEDSVQDIIHSTSYMSLLTIGILAPIIEEIVFRKSFRDIFSKSWLFILASGLIFGALHVVIDFNSLWDFLYIIPYSSLGIAFAIAYVKTDNIYTSIFMHMFHNTALTLLSIIQMGVILW